MFIGYTLFYKSSDSHGVVKDDAVTQKIDLAALDNVTMDKNCNLVLQDKYRTRSFRLCKPDFAEGSPTLDEWMEAIKKRGDRPNDNC